PHISSVNQSVKEPKTKQTEAPHSRGAPACLISIQQPIRAANQHVAASVKRYLRPLNKHRKRKNNPSPHFLQGRPDSPANTRKTAVSAADARRELST
ncbi:MAG: hypothetical protein KGN33_15320, partial [Paracoccaceae bacterium]|nr:hypothetical protein [Paracoccaceae bacterium]